MQMPAEIDFQGMEGIFQNRGFWHARDWNWLRRRKALDNNSLPNETGNYFGRAGNFGARIGNFTCQNRKHRRIRFSVHTADHLLIDARQ